MVSPTVVMSPTAPPSIMVTVTAPMTPPMTMTALYEDHRTLRVGGKRTGLSNRHCGRRQGWS
jgi:hypothetical protein